jgi:hypothetical protein
VIRPKTATIAVLSQRDMFDLFKSFAQSDCIEQS